MESIPGGGEGSDLGAPSFDVIIVAYGPEPLLERCVDAVLDSSQVDLRILLIDNGCTNPNLERIRSKPSVEYVVSPSNLGFAGGVMVADPLIRAEHVALVNSDVLVESDVLSRLATSLEAPEIGIVMPLILRLRDGLVNCAGNPLHILGYSWAGSDGAPPTSIASGPVAIASGAMLALRHSVWRQLGGLPEPFFLYSEDVDLSIACHQAGYDVILDATAKVLHDHDWGRNPRKVEFAERNRLAVMLTRYPAGVLLRLLPLLLVAELGAILLGGLPGARLAKLRGYSWLARNASWLRRRRRANLDRAVAPAAFLARASSRFDDFAPDAGSGPRLLDAVVPHYARILGIGSQDRCFR